MWVASDVCHVCANPNKFHFKDSKTFQQQDNELSTLRYGQGQIWGFDTTDQVCLAKDSVIGNGCMEDYLFKTVVNQEALGGLWTSGLIGLAPSGGWSGAQLFVPSLYKQGAIKNNMFSMFIDQTSVSKIQYGGYDLKKYASGPISWFHIKSESFWDMRFDNVKLGNLPFKATTHRIMADTGTSLNMLPDDDFFAIKNSLFKDANCWVVPNTLTVCKCDQASHEKVPDITFEIEGETFVINRDMWYERKDDQCVIKFMHAPGRTEWILGVNFFQNYYSVMDYETKRIGLAKSINFGKPGSKKFIDWALSGTFLLNLKALNSVAVDLKIAVALLALAVVIFFASFAMNKKKVVKATVMQNEEHAGTNAL